MLLSKHLAGFILLLLTMSSAWALTVTLEQPLPVDPKIPARVKLTVGKTYQLIYRVTNNSANEVSGIMAATPQSDNTNVLTVESSSICSKLPANGSCAWTVTLNAKAVGAAFALTGLKVTVTGGGSYEQTPIRGSVEKEIYAGSSLLAVTNTGEILQSIDGGNTWVKRYQTPNSSGLQYVKFNGLHAVASGAAGIFYSVDNGESWKQARSALDDGNRPGYITAAQSTRAVLFRVPYGGNSSAQSSVPAWISIGGEGMGKVYGTVIVGGKEDDSDPSYWSQVRYDFRMGKLDGVSFLATGSAPFSVVAVRNSPNSNSLLYYKDDNQPNVWKAASYPRMVDGSTIDRITALNYTDGKYVALGLFVKANTSYVYALQSTSGANWTAMQGELFPDHSTQGMSINYNGEYWLATGNSDARMAISLPGQPWKKVDTNLDVPMNTAVWIGDKWVVAGANNIIATNPNANDSNKWTPRTTRIDGVSINDIAWNGVRG